MNATTEGGNRFNNAVYDFDGTLFYKNWALNMPKDATAQYGVDHAAEWLWMRFITEMDNYGPLERAHLYALLATGQDLSRQIYPAEPGRMVTLVELNNDAAVMAAVDALGEQSLALDSADQNTRTVANERIGQAINFIISTPFMLAQEGR